MLFTPEDTIPLRGPVLLKKLGLILLYWQELETLFVLLPMFSPFAIQTQQEDFLTLSTCESTFLFKLTIYKERKGLLLKQLPL